MDDSNNYGKLKFVTFLDENANKIRLTYIDTFYSQAQRRNGMYFPENSYAPPTLYLSLPYFKKNGRIPQLDRARHMGRQPRSKEFDKYFDVIDHRSFYDRVQSIKCSAAIRRHIFTF